MKNNLWREKKVKEKKEKKKKMKGKKSARQLPGNLVLPFRADLLGLALCNLLSMSMLAPLESFELPVSPRSYRDTDTCNLS